MRAVFAALRSEAKTRPSAVALRDGATVLDWSGLAGRVAGLAAALSAAPPVIGIGVAGGMDFVVADLAATLTGRRVVPLPFFFSPEQLAHVVRDAGIGAVIGRDPALTPGLPLIAPETDGPADLPDYPGGATRVIYTSGSSGNPKGVIHGDRQLGASLAALSGVVGAGRADRHLSILPLAQLLEQICGVFLPILAGAETVFSPAATRALFGGPIAALTDAMAETQPTTTVLAPVLLARWTEDMRARGLRAPASLRLVAVGGAATPPAVIAAARALGAPVCEGYGLSECCAVVAMNRPGEDSSVDVGRPLPGLVVAIEDGEIVVEGPTVMDSYLGGPPAPRRWRTGDRGQLHEGRLIVDGRKDALIVRGSGRNISPEWIEARLDADPRVAGSALCHRRSDDALVVLIAARGQIRPDEVASRLLDLPDYARPSEAVFLAAEEPGFLFPSGAPNRAVAARLVGARQSLPLPGPLPAIEGAA
jgi:long-subunit acyl-CoA synthetase (AMP-forming)